MRCDDPSEPPTATGRVGHPIT